MFSRVFGLFAATAFVVSIIGHLLTLVGIHGQVLDVVRWTATVAAPAALVALGLGFVYQWWNRLHLRRDPQLAIRSLTELSEPVSAALDRTFLPLVTSARVSGAAVALELNGQPAFRAYAPPDAQPPIDERTAFEIGSVTKTFTALLLAQLVVAGEVTLEDPVSRYLPDVQLGSATLLDLATHHAGIPRLPASMVWAVMSRQPDPYSGWNERRLEAAASRVTPRSAPGTRLRYSNFGYAVLGLVISRRTGMAYEELIVSRICEPLGMTDTSVGDAPNHDGRLAHGHDYFGGRAANWHMAAMAPCGGIRSTAADMRRYLAAQMHPDQTPFPDAIRLAQEPRRDYPLGWQARLHGATAMRRIGLAWITSPSAQGSTIVWHNGATYGYGSFLGFTPERRVGVVALTNSAHSYRLDGGCRDLLASVTPALASPVP
jgi:CubicO group peptidase (beta-lactamase class C family)